MTTQAKRNELRGIIAATESEMPTTPRWRAMMRRGRAAYGAEGITQAALAELLDVSQTVISDIETGAQAQSRIIPAIAAALEIPLPYIEVQSEWDLQWHEAGAILREMDQELFLSQLNTVKLQSKKK